MGGRAGEVEDRKQSPQGCVWKDGDPSVGSILVRGLGSSGQQVGEREAPALLPVSRKPTLIIFY